MSVRLRSAILVSAVLFPMVIALSSNQVAEPFKFFQEYVGLNDQQMAAIRNGKALARVLESPTPDEVFVFGAVYVDSLLSGYKSNSMNWLA